METNKKKMSHEDFPTDPNDPFSATALQPYSEEEGSSSTGTQHSNHHQWTIPDSESGEYLNTLELRLQKLTNGRVMGRSRFFGHSLNPSNKFKKNTGLVASSSGLNQQTLTEGTTSLLEDEEVDRAEIVGGKPLLSEEADELPSEDSQIATIKATEEDFEDLQLDELQGEDWLIKQEVMEDETLSEEEEEHAVDHEEVEEKAPSPQLAIQPGSKRFYDLSTGELIFTEGAIVEPKIESDDEEEEEEEEEDIYDTMENLDLEDEGFHHYQQTAEEEKPATEDDNNDWEADFSSL